MIVNFGHGYTAVWNGSHTINFFDEYGVNFDCSMFGFEKDRPSQLDALQALINYDNEVPY